MRDDINPLVLFAGPVVLSLIIGALIAWLL